MRWQTKDFIDTRKSLLQSYFNRISFRLDIRRTNILQKFFGKKEKTEDDEDDEEEDDGGNNNYNM